MAADEDENIDDLVSKVCKDALKRRSFKEKCQSFLTNVKIPSGWEGKGYKLQQKHRTYKYRFLLLGNFIDKKKSEGFSLTSTTSEQFFDELKQFSDSQSDGRFSDLDYDHKNDIDLLEQNVKLQGVVVRKSDKWAYVLIRKEGRSGQGDTGSLSELVVSLHDEGKSGEGFHLKVAEGDIVEVTKCRRRKEMALEPEIIKCFSLSETDIESFLNHLSSCVHSNGSSATVTEITRFHAAWEYILHLSKERYVDQMTLQILEIINKICSSGPMSHTVCGIVHGFQQSVLFRSALPGFIDKMTEESNTNVSMVQKILEHVITAVPASGLQVLPMATLLAQNLVKSSSDLEKAKDNGLSAIEFLSKLLSVLASEVPGARKDVETLPWKELPLIPVAQEIRKPRLKTDDLPVIRKVGKYVSEEDYLNTYFRLLREECFYKLRKGISDFVESGQKCDSKDMMMYRVFLLGCSTRDEQSPTVMLISLKYEVPESQDESECEHLEWLHGNLLCISLDGSFQEPVWAIVEKHIVEHRIVSITLCDKANAMAEPQFIAKMQEITNKNKRAFMAESQTFYVAYAPAMEILQHRDHVPFKDFLVNPDPKHMEPPEYIHKIKCPPNWEIIFEKESLSECSRKDESSTDYSLLNDFDGIRMNSSCKAKLDETQLAAVELALKNKLVLIQGPPGTGKSFVGVALVSLLLSMNVPQDHGPILVVTYKNHALDNFLKDCLDKVSSPDVKIVRVGRLDENADEKLRKCLLREVGRYWPERLYNQKRKLLGQIWALQPKVREAFEKLRTSSRFSADMFLKEASNEQLKYLVVDRKQGKQVTKEDMEALINEQPKNKARLRELVENALKDWLPDQRMFDRFAGEEKKPSQGNNSTERDQKKGRKDEDLQENPNDFRDPSVEHKERLLALEEEIADEEDKEIAKEEDTSSQDPPHVQCLRNLVCLDEKGVRDFRDLLDESKVWNLNENKRVHLVYVLQSEYFLKASSEFLDVSKEYMQLHHRLKELRHQQDIEVMKKCHVIGMTVTGATMRANLLADIKPSVMIVEEAAEILEGQLVAVIPPSVQHLIMIGDHKQLKPVVYFQRLKKHHHLDLSMFERLINCKLPYRQLGFQCRMRDEFVDLLRELKIYSELKTHHKLVKGNDSPACVESSMYFWTHTKWESESKAHSKRNSREAQEITEVAKTFCQEGRVSPSKITVLCSYRGQVQEIKNHFSSSKVTALGDITVTTIDSFQGQENNIILISLVRSNKEGKIGYLSSMNRLCVAISRARCGLYLFGNHVQLSRASSKGWRVVSDFMRKKGLLGSRFPFSSSERLQSPRHADTPFVPTTVINISDVGQANVNIGGANSVNTINVTDSGGPPSVTTSPPRSGFHLSSPPSGKMPVHDPMTPPPSCPGGVTSILDTSTPGSATKDARTPTQESPKKEKSLDSGEAENLKEIPVPETPNPKDSVDKTPEKEDPILQELASEEVSKEKPIQETEEAKSGKEELKDQPEGSTGHVLQEDVVKEDKAVEQTEHASQNMPSDEHEGDASGERPLQEFEEFDKEKPLQETAEPGKEVEDLSEVKPLQETASSEDKTDRSIKDEPLPTQETMSAGKGPFEEIGLDKDKALQETREPSKTQEAESEKATNVSKNVPSDKHEGDTSGEQTLQDFEECDKGKPLQETGGTGKEEGDQSEGKPLQEMASSEDKTDSSIKDEPLPTQETMSAGKSPFEEIGLDKDRELEEAREQEAERKTTEGIEKGKDVLSVEDSDETLPKQETASSKVDSGSSKEEALPTQETMAAGKGPFEETGLEVGVKAQPTDEQE